jgi:hypothetical protein
VEAQNAAANRLQAQAVLYCSKAAEERIQSAKTDSISEVDSDMDSPIENSSAHGTSTGHKRTRSQSSMEDTNTRNQRLRTGSVDGTTDQGEVQVSALNHEVAVNTANNSSISNNDHSNIASIQQPSPRLAAKVEKGDDARQAMLNQQSAASSLGQTAVNPTLAPKPDQSMMYAPPQQWAHRPAAPAPNQAVIAPASAGYPTGAPIQPGPAMSFYSPHNFYGRPNQNFVSVTNDSQVMRGQRPQMGFQAYSDQIPHSPNSNVSQSIPTGAYIPNAYPPNFNGAPEMMRYGYINPGSQGNPNMAMRSMPPLMNQMPNNQGMQMSVGSSSGHESQHNQAQLQQAQIQQARMHQHAAMQAQMQIQMSQGGPMGPSGVQVAQIQQMPQQQQMQPRNGQPPPPRNPNF